jgi:hypothetical protein
MPLPGTYKARARPKKGTYRRDSLYMFGTEVIRQP